MKRFILSADERSEKKLDSMTGKIKTHLQTILNGDGDEIIQNILIREIEESFGLVNITDFLFFNDTLPDGVKIEKLLRDIMDSEKNIPDLLSALESKIELANLILPHLEDKYFIESTWLAVEEEEMEVTQERLGFQFSDSLKWFYSNFMSFKIQGFEVYGFGQSGVQYNDGEHPIISINKGRAVASELLFGVYGKHRCWINRDGAIYLEHDDSIKAVEISLIDFLKEALMSNIRTNYDAILKKREES